MPSDPTQAAPYPAIDFPDVDSILPLTHMKRPFLVKILSRLKIGRIVIQIPSGDRYEYSAPTPGPEAMIVLHNWRPIRRLIANGDLGFAESYMDEEWSTPNLPAFLELAARNIETLNSAIAGSLILRTLNRLRHMRSANTRKGSRRNIASHYDLGNDFYERWLDGGMSYSSAYYDRHDQSLEDAQTAKQDRIADSLALSGGERILEIGCGWGGLAEKLISRGAGHVTGLTLSTEQLKYADQRLSAAGMAEKADMRLQDYRDVDGKFDRIVSIEMLEAVGQEYWPTYFDTIRQRLKDNGSAAIQVITIAKSRYDSYRRGADFIQRYIFPGGMLPTDEIVRDEVARAGLKLNSVETFGQSYALTLAEWRRRFHDAWPAIQTFGFDGRFNRMWEYYLSYCEAGFKTGLLDVGLYNLSGPAGA
jgi:cyclopropane-fatty-acyl-phospholipid synthase